MKSQTVLSDRVLIVNARAGNRNAFGELVRRHSSRVFGMSLKMLRNREDAEDNLHERIGGESPHNESERKRVRQCVASKKRGWTNRELAKTLHMAPATVKSRIFRARVRLRKGVLTPSKTELTDGGMFEIVRNRTDLALKTPVYSGR